MVVPIATPAKATTASTVKHGLALQLVTLIAAWAADLLVAASAQATTTTPVAALPVADHGLGLGPKEALT